MKNDIGKKVWHRMFGWCVITHPYTPTGKTLVTSERQHIQQYIAGKGWIDYIGSGEGGKIVAVFVHKDELHEHEVDDDKQKGFRQLFRVLK